MTLKEMTLFDWPEFRGLGEILPGLISVLLLLGPIAAVIAAVVICTAK